MHANNKKAVTKAKELKLYSALTDEGVAFEYQKHIPFTACGLTSETRCAYVDFLIAKEWGYIVLECDEFQHSDRDPSCDPRRDFDILASVTLGSAQRLRIVHFNPDPYRVGGVKRQEHWKDRFQRLLALIKSKDAPAHFERVFICYDTERDDCKLPIVARSWDSEDAKAVSWCLGALQPIETI